jgi:threonyl-tRNA synthetase
MLVVGKREAAANAVAVRLRTEQDLGAMPVDEFIQMAQNVIQTKSTELAPAG